MKLKKKAQTKRDVCVNLMNDVVNAKSVWVAARRSRATQLNVSNVIKKQLYVAVEKAKKEYDRVLEEKRRDYKLTARIISYDIKMENEVNKARDATTFFLSQFSHVLEPNFAANKGMVKRGKKNELPKDWKSKGQ